MTSACRDGHLPSPATNRTVIVYIFLTGIVRRRARDSLIFIAGGFNGRDVGRAVDANNYTLTTIYDARAVAQTPLKIAS